MIDFHLPDAGAPPLRFALLTNHGHVLTLIAQQPDIRMREIAVNVGITERAVQRIVDELTTCGYIVVTKDGRRNRYEIRRDHQLRHPVEQHRSVGDLVSFMIPQFQQN
jgi:DNA-binding IclR family transcriptional regulator